MNNDMPVQECACQLDEVNIHLTEQEACSIENLVIAISAKIMRAMFINLKESGKLPNYLREQGLKLVPINS